MSRALKFSLFPLSPFLSSSLPLSLSFSLFLFLSHLSQVSLLGNEVELKQALKYLMSHAIKVSATDSVVRVRGVIVERPHRVSE